MQTRILTYILGCLNLLLVFLVCFDDLLSLPAFLQWSGRLHPLLLHFPLALMVITAIIYLFFPAQRINPVFDTLFLLSSLTAVFSALTGLFLSHGGDYEDTLLTRHMWLGTGISVMAFLLWRFRDVKAWKSAMLIIALPLLFVGGHYGAALTHGENYLSWQEGNGTIEQMSITDSSRVYASLIEPILASKCYSCHNEKKAKGQLIMTSMAGILKGGKDGPLWKAGDALNSHIMQRVQLAEDDKKHMPPRGKPQLSDKEIELLGRWIAEGADTVKRFMDYPATDSFRIFLTKYIPTGSKTKTKTYDFAAADPSVIEKLRSPYCDITPLATGSPALAVRFMIRSGYDPAMLGKLEKLSDQIVEINLSGMPVTDKDLEKLSSFKHLETLILNNTSITGQGLAALNKIPSLQSLAISGTSVTAASLQNFVKGAAIKRIYCWNTSIADKDLATLQPLNPALKWDLGTKVDPNEILRLTPPQYVERDYPIIGKGDTVRLKHPMPGVKIYYTLDGSAPDSLRATPYQKGIAITRASRLRAIACREGWITSDTLEKLIYVRSTTPATARLNTKSDTIYKLLGAPSLIDGKIGEVNNTGEHWMGFHGTLADISFSFPEPKAFNEVVVSTLHKTGPHIFPPSHLELWAGNDTLHLQKLSSLDPIIPDHYDRDRIEAQVLPSSGTWKYYRIKVWPVKKLPNWHEGKGKKVWVFLDEVFFN